MIKFLKNELSKNIAEKNKNQQYNIGKIIKGS